MPLALPCFRVEKNPTHLLVDGEEVNVGFFHGKQKHQSTAHIADPRRATAAMHEGTETTQQESSVWIGGIGQTLWDGKHY